MLYVHVIDEHFASMLPVDGQEPPTSSMLNWPLQYMTNEDKPIEEPDSTIK